MKVLVLNGSPRPENVSTTAALCRAFAEGAFDAGHDVTVLPVGRMSIAGCTGCEYCHTEGNGTCVQRDDQDQVYEELKQAEVLILASPVYYFTFSAQLQAAIHRTYALMIPRSVKAVGAILSSGSSGVYEPAKQQYLSSMVDWYGVRDLGLKTMCGSDDMKEKEEEMREFGRNL